MCVFSLPMVGPNDQTATVVIYQFAIPFGGLLVHLFDLALYVAIAHAVGLGFGWFGIFGESALALLPLLFLQV